MRANFTWAGPGGETAGPPACTRVKLAAETKADAGLLAELELRLTDGRTFGAALRELLDAPARAAHLEHVAAEREREVIELREQLGIAEGQRDAARRRAEGVLIPAGLDAPE